MTTARPVYWCQWVNGPLMARTVNNHMAKIQVQARSTRLTCTDVCGAGDGNRTRMTSLEGVWRTGVRAVELETLMLVSSRGYPLLTMVNGPLMAWRSWPDSFRSPLVCPTATTSAPWCCSPFRALAGCLFRLATSGWTRPLLPPTRLLPNPGTTGSIKAVFACT
jgi:hypothetical protein